MYMVPNIFTISIPIIWVVSIAMILRSRLEPIPALLWIMWSILCPIVGGLTAILYFRQRRKSGDAGGRP